ncbi:hypothetical protein ILUMI_00233 [Ignelater luminosus]|uniref:Uncharacterized protein n=1 Tax=Ignelater luminosus TaxID=2038154 RepID=A0A8K0DM11_IGNLU|nr:hypothetical protein ILUMI_00233 [Ignelater luminosus]
MPVSRTKKITLISSNGSWIFSKIKIKGIVQEQSLGRDKNVKLPCEKILEAGREHSLEKFSVNKEGRKLSREEDKLNYVNHLSRNLTNMEYREDIQSHWKALRDGMEKSGDRM